MSDVSILIVCYKSRDLIKDCLDGVYRNTTGCEFEVLLVDCSNDGTTDFIRSEYPSVRVIENSVNLGFGGGNNLLAQHATGRFLVLLNPDVIVKDDAIGELYRTAVARPQAGAVGGRARLPDGSRDPGCRQVIPTLRRLFIAAVGGAKSLNGALPEDAREAAEVETLSGAFMLVRTDAWREAAGFDTSFFMYSEELDLCHRLRHRGWGIVMTPHAEVVHLVGGGHVQSPRRVRLMTTARMHFFRKHWNQPRTWLAGFLIWIHGFLRVLLGTLGSPVLGKDRAHKLRNAYLEIVIHPRAWWGGFGREIPQ